MPPRRLCKCEKSVDESTEAERKKNGKKSYVPECPVNVDSHLLVVKFQKKLKRKKKKTYPYLCPVNVDWQLNVPLESSDQMRIVLSSLPLASLPSLLHATDFTL